MDHIKTHILTFDANNYNWAPTPEYNRIFVRSVESFMNQKLAAKGHLFLNEIHDALGFKRTRAGVIQGWIYNSDNPRPVALEFDEENNTLEITIVTEGNIHELI